MLYRHSLFQGRFKLRLLLGLFGLILALPARAGTLPVRVMGANITSGSGSYQTAGIDIFQGLRPDVAAIQEFKYGGNTPTEIRAFVDTAFGTNFYYFRESGYSIPNGIISRWPISSAGSWPDPEVTDRGVAWARIDLPGSNDLYVISVHLYNSGTEAQRNTEAITIKSNVQALFPANAWIMLAGDCNVDARTEAAISTFKTFLSDNPIPTDQVTGGNFNSNEPRNKPYDYVLPSFGLTNFLTPSVIGANTFSNGLVFDSAVFATFYPIADVAPVAAGDSHVSGMQHMAVIKDFLIPLDLTNPPSILTGPKSLTVPQGSNAVFTVDADGAGPLSYQWRFGATNLAGATGSSFTRFAAQPGEAGDYSVIVSNDFGSITSALATLTIYTGPVISMQPQSQSVAVGVSVTFTVTASGPGTLYYQWRLAGTNLPAATATNYALPSVHAADAGDYSVVITNASATITSAVATLVIDSGSGGTPTTLAGWDVSGVSGFGPSPLSPTTNAPHLVVTGLSRGAGVGTSGSAAGRAWGGTGFDTASATAGANANDYAAFTFYALTGYRVSVSALSRFDYRRSNTGPPSGTIQYQVGGGAFVDLANVSYGSSSSGGSLGPFDLSGIFALQNVAASNVITFRIVNYGGASGGTWYVYDTANSTALDLALTGVVTPVTSGSNPPPAAPVLGAPAFSGADFVFSVTGSVGTNYQLQASTNLTSWVTLATNTSPFTFTETNAVWQPARFYRAVFQP